MIVTCWKNNPSLGISVWSGSSVRMKVSLGSWATLSSYLKDDLHIADLAISWSPVHIYSVHHHSNIYYNQTLLQWKQFESLINSLAVHGVFQTLSSYQVLSGYCMIVLPFMYPTPENDPLRNPTTTVLLVCVRLIIMIIYYMRLRTCLFHFLQRHGLTNTSKTVFTASKAVGQSSWNIQTAASPIHYHKLLNHCLATSTVKTGSAYYYLTPHCDYNENIMYSSQSKLNKWWGV